MKNKSRKKHEHDDDLPVTDYSRRDESDEPNEFTEEDFEEALEKVSRREKPKDDKGKGKKKK
jgi:hypothetical protein